MGRAVEDGFCGVAIVILAALASSAVPAISVARQEPFSYSGSGVRLRKIGRIYPSKWCGIKFILDLGSLVFKLP